MLGSLKYLPQLKWKQGEYSALNQLSDAVASMTGPIIKLMPCGDYDNEDKVVHPPETYLQRIAQRIYNNWGKRIIFVDMMLLDVREQNMLFGERHFETILEAAWKKGCNVAPVVSLRNSFKYLQEVKSFLCKHSDAHCMIRISLSDFEHGLTNQELIALASDLGRAPSQIGILFDAHAPAFADIDRLADISASAISALCRPNFWGTLAWSSTSFPESPKVPPGTYRSFPRSDRELYLAIWSRLNKANIAIEFSDYACEFPGNYEPIKAKAVAQIRYTTANQYFIFKGKQVREPAWNEVIRPVVDAFFASGIYFGRDYSLGDAYWDYVRLNKNVNGSASMWRKAATTHHIQVVADEIRRRAAGQQRQVEVMTRFGQFHLIQP